MNQLNDSRPKLGSKIRVGENPGGRTNPTQRDSDSNLLTGWKEPDLNPDQGYDDVHTRKWSFVIDISVLNPC